MQILGQDSVQINTPT